MVYTNGSYECVQNPFFGSSNNGVFIDRKASNIAVPVGSSMGNSTNIAEHTAIGLTKDSSKSGIVGSATIKTNIIKQVIIKY